ncbi:cytochrome oxidase assembly [Candidatus Halobonum tyrrellensis G22]|uniref:Cytochrome oxidase assembly n=2 Tax=Candidatus Halobonum TaxID=1431544 RepID=V4IX62_9EURY|nr:COX15/CtaA family protein [Candidatus Halobonum tyrrellensis]ESP87762.1 cytochrome oxidase assembly [Candidatus Halobonum tyrrellensis G22]
MTLTLVMLGVYTAATGSGLACSQQWPLCDGGVLPQTVPSFIEWFHRLWAMVTGFLILGVAVWAWRADKPKRTRWAAAGATVLTPLQAVFGAVTVTFNGRLPGGYSMPVHAAHFVTGFGIFALLAYTALLSYEGRYGRDPLTRTRAALGVALACLLASVVFSRLPPLLDYAPWAQAAFYGVSLAGFGALTGATRWLGDVADDHGGRFRPATALAGALLFVAMLLGRDLVYYSPTVRLVNAVVVAGAVALVAGVGWALRREDGPGATPVYGSTDD